jgi:hypothetical protein
VVFDHLLVLSNLHTYYGICLAQFLGNAEMRVSTSRLHVLNYPFVALCSVLCYV